MDQFIIEKARAQNKTLRTFETLDEQFHYLDKVFTVEQLREMLAESEENRRYYEQLAGVHRTVPHPPGAVVDPHGAGEEEVL